MSNVPTEFDKELGVIIDMIGHAGANGDNRVQTRIIYLAEIKELVDRYVNDEDEENAVNDVDWHDDKHPMKIMFDTEQRKAPHGGDKK